MKSMMKVAIVCLAGMSMLVTHLYAAEFTIRIANDVAANHNWGRASELLKKNIEDLTKGRVKVDVHHAGTLVP